MKKYKARRKLRKFSKRRKFSKKRYYKKSSKSALYGKILKLRKHRQKKKPHELHIVSFTVNDLNIPTIRLADAANRFSFFQFDPSQPFFIQGVQAINTIADQINMSSIELFFDILHTDTNVEYPPEAYTPPDFYRAFRIVVVETVDAGIVARELVKYNTEVPLMYGPMDWKKCRTLFDKVYCETVPMCYNNEANVGATDEITYTMNEGAGNKRKHFHFRIPYKGTIPVDNATSHGDVTKKLYCFFWSDMSAAASNITGLQWTIANIQAFYYFKPNY